MLLRCAKQLSICGERAEVTPWQSIASSRAKTNHLRKSPSGTRGALGPKRVDILGAARLQPVDDRQALREIERLSGKEAAAVIRRGRLREEVPLRVSGEGRATQMPKTGVAAFLGARPLRPACSQCGTTAAQTADFRANSLKSKTSVRRKIARTIANASSQGTSQVQC